MVWIIEDLLPRLYPLVLLRPLLLALAATHDIRRSSHLSFPFPPKFDLLVVHYFSAVDCATMAGKPIPVPTSSLEDKVLCIEDLRQTALKKLPKGILGMCSFSLIKRTFEQSLVQSRRIMLY